LAEQVQPNASDISFLRLISTSIFAKLLVDTNTQIFNPFLHIIATGLGVDVVTLGRLLSLRSAVGIAAPLFGTLADRRGYRLVMRLGLLLSAAGMFLIGSSHQLWMAALGMIVTGLGVSAFIPTLQAYVSAHLPYSQRARALGMVEYSWAFTGIVGLSLMGWLIEATSWRTPFFLLGAGMVVMSFVFARMPDGQAEDGMGPRPTTIDAPANFSMRTRHFFALGANARSAYSTIFAGALTYLAGFQIMLIYGTWLDEQYHLDAAQLGLVALVLGLFDLAASVSVSLFTDRIGKRRSVLLGNLGALIGYLLLPWLNTTVFLTVLGIALARSCFEFTIVSHFPLLSEQAPAQRGKVMTLGSAVLLGAGTIASFSSPWLYTHYGVIGVSTVSSVMVCLAITLLFTWVNEHDPM
jgi:predicted MFS family arabinose efflux permease